MNSSSDRHARRVSLRVQLASASTPARRSAAVHMPPSMEDLLVVLEDRDLLLRMVGLFGGCTLRIPQQWPLPGKPDSKQSHPLRRLLSPRRMRLLVQHYGGTCLYIPRCHAALRHMRNTAIVLWFNQSTRRGQSSCAVVQRLAKRYGLSDRRIWDILKTEALLLTEQPEQELWGGTAP